MDKGDNPVAFNPLQTPFGGTFGADDGLTGRGVVIDVNEIQVVGAATGEDT